MGNNNRVPADTGKGDLILIRMNCDTVGQDYRVWSGRNGGNDFGVVVRGDWRQR